jgi:hypothetical protein
MPVLSDLTFKLRNQLFQLGDEGVLLSHHSLFVRKPAPKAAVKQP